MSFDETYQLVDLVEDENAKTFVAKEIATDRTVSVFLFVGDQARRHAELLERLRVADRRQFPELIEIGNNQGTPYVVTQPLSGFSELKKRALQLKSPAEAPATSKKEDFSKVGMWHVPQTLSAPPGTRQPPDAGGTELKPLQQPKDKPVVAAPSPQPESGGEFTRMFQAPAPPLGEPPVRIPEAPAGPPQPPPAAGEFTRMFQAPAPPLGEPPVRTPEAPAEPSQPPPAAGEFTRMFQAPAAPSGEPAGRTPKVPEPAGVPPRSEKSEPGEFTRFFQSAPTTAPVPPIPQKPETQGQFTRIFGAGGRPDTPPATSPRLFESAPASTESRQRPKREASVPAPPQAFNTPAGEFTRVFGGAPMEAAPSANGLSAPAEAASTPAAASAGEYTRLFSAPVSSQTMETEAEPAKEPAAAADSPAAAKPSSRLPLVLTGVIFLLLVVIVVLIFTLWK